MKNLLKIALSALLLLNSLVVLAKDDNFSLKVTTNDKKAVVFLFNSGQNYHLTFLDEDFAVIYQEDVNVLRPLSKTYNLAAFPDGDYTVKVDDGNQLLTYKLTIANGKTMVAEPLVTKLIKPVIEKDKEIVAVDLSAVEANNIGIKIVDESRNELFNDVFYTKSIKKFNIAHTSAKELTFIITANQQEFVKTIALK